LNLTTLTAAAAQFAGDQQQQRYANLYTQAANLAQQQFALDSKALWKDQSYAIVGGVATGNLPTDFMWEKAVTYSKTGANSYYALQPITRADLIRNRTDDWTQVTGDPKYYIVDPEEARKQIRIYPYPPSGDVGGALTLTYYPLPADLAAGADIPLNAYSLLAQFHVSLASWAAWFLLAAETATPEIRAKRKDLLSVYNDGVTLAVDTFKNTASAPLRMRGSRAF
jgi:type II secretory pathway pseudopilin PulG